METPIIINSFEERNFEPYEINSESLLGNVLSKHDIEACRGLKSG